MASTSLTLDVSGMTCGHCEVAIQNAISELEQVVDVRADETTGKVQVELASAVEVAALEAAVAEAGYEVTGVTGA